uniref:Serine protease n=1 Tax=Globisporangium ultimum (strain ATCC 200006 / CBS 805.95 / DAOM BR144) TaxID=431595 RepID=K3X9N1_GLOUD
MAGRPVRTSHIRPIWGVALSVACFVVILFSGNDRSSGFVFEPSESTGSQHQLQRAAESKQSSRRLSVFGDDDRRPVSDSSQYPYSAVGLLRWSADLSCTASLIGDKYVVTAAECALDADGNVLKSTFTKAEFLPGLTAVTATDTTAATKALVTKVHKQSDYWKKWTQNTYVILELDSSIGQKHGVLKLPTLSDLDQSAGKTEVQIAGYNADTAAEMTMQYADTAAEMTMQYAKCTCYFPSEFQGPQYLLHHDCDTSAAGSPGSPLLVRYTSMKTYIIGIHSNAIGNAVEATTTESAMRAAFTQDTANRGVLGPFIQKHLEFLVNSSTTGTKESASVSSGSLGNVSSTTSSTGDGDSSSSLSPVASAKPMTKRPQPAASSSSSSSGGSESKVSGPTSDGSTNAANKNELITPAVAYICIVFVCMAWMCILFIAVRHLRGSPPRNDEQYEEV